MESKSWKSLGIISTLLLIAISVFQIVDWINDNQEKVKANYSTSDYYIPKYLEDKYDWSKIYGLEDRINKIILNEIDENETSNLTDTILKIINSEFYDSFLDQVYGLNVTELNIESNSKKTVKELSIDVDSKGYYQIYTQDEKVNFSSFNHIVELEDLRPNNSIKVILWTTDGYYFDDDIIINYKDGHTSANKLVKMSGTIVFIDRFKVPISFFLVSVLMIIVAFPFEKNNKKPRVKKKNRTEKD
ncbi:hypothetical protein [Aquimarina sp. 2304DJ70-9]|uniref:hypothetical protein n=1 Tax=Aquimarina penaris TaxID=3231044 RepID=UPI0034625475